MELLFPLCCCRPPALHHAVLGVPDPPRSAFQEAFGCAVGGRGSCTYTDRNIPSTLVYSLDCSLSVVNTYWNSVSHAYGGLSSKKVNWIQD